MVIDPNAWSHEPAGYDCPFCAVAAGGSTRWSGPGDVVAANGRVLALVSPKWWPANPGHVLVVSRDHHESLYALPVEVLHAIADLTQRVARAIRTTYDCAGVSTRQHNEPAGGQDVWHFHQHVFPRWPQDRLYTRDREARWVESGERRPYAERLRTDLTISEARL